MPRGACPGGRAGRCLGMGQGTGGWQLTRVAVGAFKNFSEKLLTGLGRSGKVASHTVEKNQQQHRRP